ncbi:LLM class F420-dependent oxidoreductase [Nakamurella antarctica]|uniref:LLM class F420-dependent oxidoreductase n=1 Tax=Nakamurella antarctica TaxID=1902245 RepID=A0A3G8ZVC4_9ACTN|nr:LLM class F420-dependent oxidoreductase [Nakamurella antarctica]AZI57966.1 LLM class F420-dependent oxidoreductase [Nakamurella antarctica]
MKLGISLGYFSSAREISEAIELTQAAEALGYDVAWVAEAYGTDSPTVLSAIASRTSTIGIGAGIMQIPARSAAMTAMTAATLDAISGGRMRLGLGVSGPQVSEGWHGVYYADPLGRTAEYVAIVKQVLTRQRVEVSGTHFTLPLPGLDGKPAQGKPLSLAMKPVRTDIPIYLAAVGPKNLELTGRICDGWLAIFFDPELGAANVRTIAEAAVAAGRDPNAIDYSASVGVAVGPDQEGAAAALRPNAALYIGGMGSKATNFYHRIASSMGFEAEADEVQRLFLSKDYAGAARAVPLEFLTRTSLVGTLDDIAAGLKRLHDVGITSVNVAASGHSLADRIDILETTMHAATKAGVLA